ncbi:hypothetical protein ACXR6G_18285 [Ancylomarina sp. YFZ004]
MVFDLFKGTFIEEIISYRSQYFYLKNELYPNWFIYNLPDGLWVFSWVTLMLFIWHDENSVLSFFCILAIPFISIIHEYGQKYDLFSGTFDILDITSYLIATLIPIVFFLLKEHFILNIVKSRNISLSKKNSFRHDQRRNKRFN